jgi:bifunctional DNA-binding transcriptional regulator/antitoxin component of YhaV-PrlF toxin-antitoxin module
VEKLISIDSVGRTVLPKAIREAVNLGKGGPAKVSLGPGGVIEIRPLTDESRKIKKMGKYLVIVGEGPKRYNAVADIQAERESR